jgi:5'(3')-deoxyribonucleotidase
MKRIAIDIDEVLAPFLGTMTKWRRPRPPLPNKFNYVFREIWGTTERESNKMIKEFYDSEEFANLKTLPYSQEAMGKLKSRGNKLYIVSGRQEIVREKTEDWVEKNFPGVFADVVLTNSFTHSEVKKSDVCDMLAMHGIIDDNMTACIECANRGMLAQNFIGDPVYPWCQTNPLSIKSWKQFCDTLPEIR